MLEDAPRQEHDLYWDAFWELSTERQIGMAQGPIPVSAIKDAAADPDLQLTPRERWAFKFIIRRLDEAFLQVSNEKQKAATKGARRGR